MNFLIDIRNGMEDNNPGNSAVREIVNGMAYIKENDRLFLFTGKQEPSWFRDSGTGVRILNYPQPGGLKDFFYNLLIFPSLLKKNKIETSLIFCSNTLYKNMPNLRFIQDLSFREDKKSYRYFSANTRQKKMILTTVPALGDFIGKEFNLENDAIKIIAPFTLPGFRVLSSAEKQEIKERYSDGKEFFLYYVPQHHGGIIINILKAFSHFKRRQQSAFKMVFVFSDDLLPGVKFKLESYRYKEDVIVVHRPLTQQLQVIMASAYAVVIPPNAGGYGLLVTGAMQSSVPVIAKYPFFKDDAVIVTETDDMDELGERFISLYKDESLRKKMMAKGLEQSSGYSINASCREILKFIRESVG